MGSSICSGSWQDSSVVRPFVESMIEIAHEVLGTRNCDKYFSYAWFVCHGPNRLINNKDVEPYNVQILQRFGM